MRTVLKLKLSDHFNQMLLKNRWWSSNFYPLSTSESTTFNMDPPPSILYNQSTGRIDNRGFQGYQNSVNSGNWLIFLSISAFRATKILSTVGLHILIDRSFQSYQNPVNFKSWNSCSFQNYLTIGKTLCFPSAIRVDRATLNLEDIMLPVSYKGWQLWLWGYLIGEGIISSLSVLNFHCYCFCYDSHRACWRHLDQGPSELLLSNWGVLWCAVFLDGGGGGLWGCWPAHVGWLELLGYISCCFPYAVCWCRGPRARRAWALRLPEFAQLYPAGSLQWRFACGFNFRHGLPVEGGFAVLRGLLIVSVGTMSSF